MTEEVDRLKARTEELLELRDQTKFCDEVEVFGDFFDPWRHKFEAHRIICAQIGEQLAEELARHTEGAEPPCKGGRPKKGIAQLFDVALAMRACRALTWYAKSQKRAIAEIAKSFGVSRSTVYARTPGLSAELKEHSKQPAGEGSEKPAAARR